MVRIGEFDDFISFLDENDEKQNWQVHILDTGNLIKFKAQSGKIFEIPYTRVLKIKRAEAEDGSQ